MSDRTEMLRYWLSWVLHPRANICWKRGHPLFMRNGKWTCAECHDAQRKWLAERRGQ